MPPIMRYCFEEQVNLRERPFLRDLKYTGFDKIDLDRVSQELQLPLQEQGLIRSVAGNLIICSSLSQSKDKISFDRADVAGLVEGILRSFDDERGMLAGVMCSQVVQYYHKCLDEGFLRI